jgi:hypothetical protein
MHPSKTLTTLPSRPALQAGFTFIELLCAAVVLVLATSLGVMHTTRSSQDVTWGRESSFARQRAVSILGELKAYVEGSTSLAESLDTFDDGSGTRTELTITTDPDDPEQLVAPDHAISGNQRHEGEWMWRRKITVRPVPGASARDLRMVTVRVYRTRAGIALPGEKMAEVSSIVRTPGDAYPTTQVYDIYLLALENVPGWWVNMDAIQPFIESTISEMELVNPGLKFRTHWITELGYGRDDEYQPYSNETRLSTDSTAWTYVYPGKMPSGLAAARYYVADRFGARVNVDGATTPTTLNGPRPAEPFTDLDGDGRFDEGEAYDDLNDDNYRDPGNPVPYALADMHNHCMRWPEEQARFQARIAAGTREESTPTWRLLLDRMIAQPDRFHNAIVVNLHGELLPLPPVRNVSDPARDPEIKPGWRVVTHPELLRPARNATTPASSTAPRFRVHAFKNEILDTERLTTQREPLLDTNKNGVYDVGETFLDWNGNSQWDAGIPITLFVPGGDFSRAPNAATNPSLLVRRLPGGIDADANGSADAYQAWSNAPIYPELFTDANADGICQRAESYFDVNGNGLRDAFEPYQELDGDGVMTLASETFTDANASGRWDPARPAESFTDANANGRWDAAEPYWDVNGNGVRDAATAPRTPFVAWNPASYGNNGQTSQYLSWYGEPFRDLDADGLYDAAEVFTDFNGNRICDGGVRRGEMWFEASYDAARKGTVISLHGTPLETPYESGTTRGLPTSARLYDLDYVPCPTPATATSTNRFERDLYTASSSAPKNTARWTVELPVAAMATAFESALGAADGHRSDRIITVETRLGRDLGTGVMWPTRVKPANRSSTYAYFYADAASIPFSERYQFMGDPRHSPYADTDARGTTAAHGYNWFFDDFVNGSTTATSSWLAFDAARLDDGWLGRGSGHDVPRLFQWLRTALVKSESLYTTLTGFSYFYLSLGGDVGYDSANGFADSIPMDGTPFGLTGAVNENTLIDAVGTSTIRGSLKHVRSNAGSTSSGIRSGGVWWSKPWLGDLCPDSAYVSQWAPWGNLRAAASTASGTFRLVRRGDLPTVQQPAGTLLVNLYGRLADEGCTSLFNIGSSSSTFHHQYANGATGSLVEDGPQLAANYGLNLPSPAPISRPFGIATDGAGDVGPEFGFTTEFPRFTAGIVRRFYNHTGGQTGSAIVRLQEPGASPRGCHIVVNGLDKTTGSGSSLIARYSVLSLLHGYLAAGATGLPNRVRQLPQVEIKAPTLTTEIDNPAQILVRWATKWKRWDGLAYTTSFASTFAESEGELRYVPLWSRDDGVTWRNMLDDSLAQPGELPRNAAGAADPARTLRDLNASADETFAWSTPVTKVPAGVYMMRIEAYRASEPLHYAQHQEKIYVDR